LKNTIGISGDKNYLPHYRFGSKKEGGDAYAETSFHSTLKDRFYEYLIAKMAQLGSKSIRIMEIPMMMFASLRRRGITTYAAGDWHGNDTIWRTIIDLNRILLYADRSGLICEEQQRKYFAVVDGIIGGEGDGPFNVTTRACGMLFGGFNPVLLDSVIAGTMGFEWRLIPQIVETKETLFPSLDLDQETEAPYYNLNFQPPTGWDNLKAGDSKE